MSIGKNAIKRVENNGYSNVKTDAPDMQNSTVIGATAPEVMEMVEKCAEKKPAKKTTAKKPCTKKSCAKKDGFVRVELGGDMPYYLL